jgi:hypothetical protein
LLYLCLRPDVDTIPDPTKTSRRNSTPTPTPPKRLVLPRFIFQKGLPRYSRTDVANANTTSSVIVTARQNLPLSRSLTCIPLVQRGRAVKNKRDLPPCHSQKDHLGARKRRHTLGPRIFHFLSFVLKRRQHNIMPPQKETDYNDAALARALQEEYEREYRRRGMQQHLRRNQQPYSREEPSPPPITAPSSSSSLDWAPAPQRPANAASSAVPFHHYPTAPSDSQVFDSSFYSNNRNNNSLNNNNNTGFSEEIEMGDEENENDIPSLGRRRPPSIPAPPPSSSSSRRSPQVAPPMVIRGTEVQPTMAAVPKKKKNKQQQSSSRRDVYENDYYTNNNNRAAGAAAAAARPSRPPISGTFCVFCGAFLF